MNLAPLEAFFKIRPVEPQLEREFVAWKFRETRPVVLLIATATPLLAWALWVWDWAIDPAGAWQVLPTRFLLGAILTLYPIILLLRVSNAHLPWLYYLVIWAAETDLLYHFTFVEGGLVYGISGFMYWFLIPVFVAQPFRLRYIVLGNFVSAMLPNLLVLLGMGTRLELAKYNAIILPTYVISVLISIMLDNLHGRIFLSQRRVEELARTDALTRIANRRSFMEQSQLLLESARRYERPLSMLMIDIDHFKSINDHHGHPVGDQVLQHVAQKLQLNLRTADVLGRYGGEEFAVTLPETPQEQALDVGEKLRAMVAESPVSLDDDTSFALTVSVGVVGQTRLDSGCSVESILRKADQALYEAKHGGRNQTVAYEGQTAAAEIATATPSRAIG